MRQWLCGLLLLLAACSKSPEPVAPETAPAPALWKVGGPKGSAWLFGTIHVLPIDTDWQTTAFDAAVREADSLVLEATGLDDPQAVGRAFAEMGFSGGQPPLSGRIDPKLSPTLDQLDHALPGPRAVLDHMESWAAALALASAGSADLGLSQGRGVEQVLMLRFRADEKPIGGLETISAQFSYFDRLPEVEQRKLLDAVLRGSATARADFERLLAAWLAGDVERLLRDQNDGILASPAIREALLHRRNRDWAVKIGGMLERGERPLIAVGAAHVAGPVGVPALLKAAGYRVERVQ